MQLARRCACGAAITHPSAYATRCEPCDDTAQRAWFGWLATLPETRGYAGDLPAVDRYVIDPGAPPSLAGRVSPLG